jgi:hypothetical protein
MRGWFSSARCEHWEELLDGKYEWSSMSKLLRKKGLIE